jgi:hypothetical protein
MFHTHRAPHGARIAPAWRSYANLAIRARVRYAVAVTTSTSDHETPVTRAGVVTTVSVSELGEAMDAVARRRAPVVYFGTVAVCLGFFGFALYALLLGARVTFAPVLLLVTATMMLPWVRHRLNARLFRRTAPVMFEPFTIEAFAPGLLYLRQGNAKSETRLDSFAIRAETARVFAFGREGTAICIAIPKRAFTDPVLLEAFREVFTGRARPHAVAEAVRTFDDGDAKDAIHYQLDADEQRHGVGLVLAKSWMRFMPWVSAGFIVVVSLVMFIARGPVMGTGVMLALFALTSLLRARFLAQSRVPPPASIALDDDTLRFASRAGNVELRWSELRGRIEDEKLLILLAHRNTGLFIPKRVLDDARLAFIRARVPSR